MNFIRYKYEVFVAVVFPNFSSYFSKKSFKLGFPLVLFDFLVFVHCLVAQ